MPRKKVALALAGAGARAVMYFGILDVFKEQGIPVDYISALSSSTMVACAYSCGNMDALRRYLVETKFSTGDLFSKILEPTMNGGIFSLEKIDDLLREFITAENLEDLPIPVAIVAADLVHGNEVIFTIGDTFRAIRASCTMPGLFEPVIWGNKILIDGGILSIIPVEAAKQFGADVIIGFDLATTDKIFPDNWLRLKRGYNFLTRPIRYISFWKNRLVEKFWRNDDEMHIDEVKVPNMFRVIDKALDYAMTERRKAEYYSCDIIIKPDVKGFTDTQVEGTNTEKMYQEGRRAALMAIPRIKEILNS